MKSSKRTKNFLLLLDDWFNYTEKAMARDMTKRTRRRTTEKTRTRTKRTRMTMRTRRTRTTKARTSTTRAKTTGFSKTYDPNLEVQG